MRYAKLLRTLARCTADASSEPAVRHIIRFASRREYGYFIRQLNAAPSSRMKAAIRKLRLIHAVSFVGTALPGLNHKGIHFIEKDVRIRMSGAGTFASGQTPVPWGIQRIRAPRAWKIATGRSVKVGVIDTGVNFHHPDLKHSLAPGYNVLQRGFLPWDDNGHGTHITGTIVAAAQGNGIWGTAPGATVYPVKAFDRNGSAYVSDIIQGMEWCLREGIRLINMSFGMTGANRAFREAIRSAYQRGAIIVASAGNDGKDTRLDYPAQYPNTIAIGATSSNGRIAKFSNRGGRVHLYAPGSKITSTWLNRGYAALSGTSMSTSHVSGAIALALSLRPDLTPWQVRQMIYETGRPLHGSSGKQPREIDAYRLVSAVLQL